MLGHRGCRLAITYPEICEMQARAIIEAAVEVSRNSAPPIPEIMIPLAATAKEIEICKEIIDRVAQQVMQDSGQKIEYLVGTMIELPRAALKADELAGPAEFFSFGTNDLTQTTLGISRDDAGSFLGDYSEANIYPVDPFVSIDVDGVGILVEMAAQKGRSVRQSIKLGICGEHGGDPNSITFCETIGLDYISCSPFRVPIARLAAAQATIKLKT
jgi:pyruvate,orthophosphate dikinase